MTQTLEQKLEALGLSSAAPKELIRQQLKAVRNRTHPDTTGGNFQNKKQELDHLTAAEALDLMDQSPGGNDLQVLAVNQHALAEMQASLVKIFDEQRQLAKTDQEAKAGETIQARAEAAIARKLQQKYRPFAVGGWSVAALAAAIGLLDKPLGGFIQELFAGNAPAAHYAKLMLGAITVLGVILGFYAKQRESKEQERIKALMTDAGSAYILYHYSWRIFDQDEGERTFSLASLTDAVRTYTKVQDWSACEATAEAISLRWRGKSLVSFSAANPSTGFNVLNASNRLDFPLSLRPRSAVIFASSMSPLSVIDR